MVQIPLVAAATPPPFVTAQTALITTAAPVPPPHSSLPSAPPPSSTTTAQLAQAGRQLYRQASAGSSRALLTLTVTSDQAVDEGAAANKAHGIISVYEGENVTLIEGSPKDGLPAPYEDYVLVRRSDGREGRVSRYIVALARDP